MRLNAGKRFYLAALIVSLLFICSAVVNAQPWVLETDKIKNADFYDAQKEFKEYWQDKKPGRGTGWKQFKRLEWFWEQRVYPNGEFPDALQIHDEHRSYLEKHIKKDLPLADDLYEWSLTGPSVKPADHNQYPPAGMGRMNCISFHPSDENIIWAGAAFGGVWKTTNGGGSWHTFPFTEFLSIGISDIACSPSNPNVVYAATGDADAAGVLGALFNYSIGIVKTTDNGSTWSLTSPLYGEDFELSNQVLINRLLVHPSNENIVYAASNKGLYKTEDGGKNWSRLSSIYCRDLEFKPGDPSQIIGAFREISGNNYVYSIAKVNPFTGNIDKKQQFTDVIRIALNVTQADPNTMYALCAGYDMGFHSFLRTTDGGENWTITARKSTHPNYLHFYTSGSMQGGQGLYDLCLAADPENEDIVFIGGINVWKTTNGGADFSITTDWRGKSAPWIHADIHSLEYNPKGVLFACTDGGINKTKNGGTSWTDISNGLEVTQFYRIDQHPADEDLIIGGTQDNGTHLKSGSTWKNILGSDGMDCKIDYNDSRYLYASTYNGSFWRSTNGGSSFFYMIDDNYTRESGAWISPMAMDPRDPKILYIGHHNIYKSTDRGAHWKKISVPTGGYELRTIALSESNAGTIYCAAIDKVFVTHNGGETWNNIMTSNSAVTDIAVDPNNHQRCWVTLSGYYSGSKVMEINGTEKTNISGTLPNVPVNTIIYQKNSPDRLYIGTDIGVFFTDEAHNDWQPMDNGLPNVVVTDLEIHYGAGKIRAATYARGLWESKINNCNLSPPDVTAHGETEFCEGGSCKLTAPEGYESYLWNTGKTGKSIEVTESGDYYVIVTDDKGCTAASDPVEIDVHNIPDLKVNSTTQLPACDGDTVLLMASFGFSDYEWSNGETGRRIYVHEPGEYSVKGITADECENTSEPKIVIFQPKPEKPDIFYENKTLKTNVSADFYQWYIDGEPIDGAVEENYVPTESGSYKVEVFNEYQCSSISDEYNFTLSTVKSFGTSADISITPNPSEGIFYLEAFNPVCSRISVEITNLLGNKVFSRSFRVKGENTGITLNLNNLPSGVYLAMINCGGKTEIRKIIKK